MMVNSFNDRVLETHASKGVAPGQLLGVFLFTWIPSLFLIWASPLVGLS